MKNNNYLKKILSFTMVLSFVLSPVLAEAKNENKNEEKEQRKEIKLEAKAEKDFKKCFKAWGHLIAPGWLKHNSALVVPDGCIFPFGIAKKFRGNATTTPDTIAPVITNLTVNPRQTDARLRWDTNEFSNSVAYYSTSSPVNINASTTATVRDSEKVKEHSLWLQNLVPNTTYFVFVTSKDKAGNVATSSTTSFTTTLNLDITAPVIRNVIATNATTTLSASWKTNELATTKIYYSTTTPINLSALSTKSLENTTLVVNHMMTISGLTTSTTYYLILESKDSSGNTQRTNQFSLTTSAGM